MSKYDPLRMYLREIPPDQTEVRLTFGDLEKIVGILPASARNHRPWWANDASHSHSSAWQQAGFRIQQVSMTAELVVFARVRLPRPPADITGGTLTSDQLHLGGPTQAATVGDDHTEAVVQARLVAYLTGQQWHLERVADTARREQGIDILASKDGRTLAVEVKGYPSRNYADPRRAGQVKPTNPPVQARHWYAQALLKAMLTREEHPTYEIAVAFPDVPTYRSLQQRTRTSLADLAITTFFVVTDGTVHTPPNTP